MNKELYIALLEEEVVRLRVALADKQLEANRESEKDAQSVATAYRLWCEKQAEELDLR